jgi:hypothetical protein
MPVGGTVNNFFIHFSAAPGAGASYKFTIQDGGSNVGSPAVITCTITDPATSCSDTTDSAAFNAGDLFSIHLIITGTATTNPTFTWSVQYH